MPLSFSCLIFAQRMLSELQPSCMLHLRARRFRRGRGVVSLGAPPPVPADETREERDEDDDRDHDLDVLVDSRNIAAQEIADRDHAPDLSLYTSDAADDLL